MTLAAVFALTGLTTSGGDDNHGLSSDTPPGNYSAVSEREVGGGHAHSVIADVGASSSSRGGVRVTPRGSVTVKQDLGASRSETCRSARKAVPYYRFWVHLLQTARDARRLASGLNIRGRSCSYARFAAREWRARAVAARDAYERWSDEWEWERWLPSKFYRVARCETAVRWDWDSGTYVSAFGIIRSGYADFARRLGLPTWDDPGRRSPREQYLVAAALQRAYSWSAWGCGGA